MAPFVLFQEGQLPPVHAYDSDCYKIKIQPQFLWYLFCFSCWYWSIFDMDVDNIQNNFRFLACQYAMLKTMDFVETSSKRTNLMQLLWKSEKIPRYLLFFAWNLSKYFFHLTFAFPQFSISLLSSFIHLAFWKSLDLFSRNLGNLYYTSPFSYNIRYFFNYVFLPTLLFLIYSFVL